MFGKKFKEETTKIIDKHLYESNLTVLEEVDKILLAQE